MLPRVVRVGCPEKVVPLKGVAIHSLDGLSLLNHLLRVPIFSRFFGIIGRYISFPMCVNITSSVFQASSIIFVAQEREESILR